MSINSGSIFLLLKNTYLTSSIKTYKQQQPEAMKTIILIVAY